MTNFFTLFGCKKYLNINNCRKIFHHQYLLTFKWIKFKIRLKQPIDAKFDTLKVFLIIITTQSKDNHFNLYWTNTGTHTGCFITYKTLDVHMSIFSGIQIKFCCLMTINLEKNTQKKNLKGGKGLDRGMICWSYVMLCYVDLIVEHRNNWTRLREGMP